MAQQKAKAFDHHEGDLTNQIPSTPQIPSIFGLKFLDTLFISPGPDQSLSGHIPDDFNMVKPVLKTIQLNTEPTPWRAPESAA